MKLPIVILIANLVSTCYMVGLIQVPCHEKLTSGFDAATHSRLVVSNWIRTIGWTVRGALVTWMLINVLSK